MEVIGNSTNLENTVTIDPMDHTNIRDIRDGIIVADHGQAAMVNLIMKTSSNRMGRNNPVDQGIKVAKKVGDQSQIQMDNQIQIQVHYIKVFLRTTTKCWV